MYNLIPAHRFERPADRGQTDRGAEERYYREHSRSGLRLSALVPVTAILALLAMMLELPLR